MAYVDQQMGGNRVVSIIIVAIIHVVIGWLLISGLAISAVKEIAEQLTTVDIEEQEEPEEEPEEPPPEQDTVPPPPVAPPPPVNLRNTPDTTQTQPDPPPPSPPATRNPPPGPPPGPPASPPPPPPPPPAPDQSAPATPSNIGRWSAQISNNYPSAALRREEEGTVGVAVTVGPNGRVASCSVTSSSGSSRLDSAACQGMQRYARFNPAKDRNGNPTTGSFSTSITYRLN